jgi:hypothetical protein
MNSSHGDADEERQRVGCERKQCPTEDAEPSYVEKNADDEHDGGSRDKNRKDRAFHHHHHHHGAILGIADPVRILNPVR